MIPCNELGQTKAYLLQQFKNCKTLKAEDMQLFVEYVYSVGLCVETGGGGLINLDYIPAEDQGTVTNTAGTSAVIPLATEEFAGLLSPQEKEKIDSAIQPDDLTAENISFDDTITQLGETNVQGAIEKTNERIDNLDITDTLENDIFSDVTTGAIDAGETVPEGTTFTGFVELLLSKTFYPTFTNWSISGNAGSSVEVGTTTKTVSITFNRGNIVGDIDSGVWNPILVQGNVLGAATKYWINGEDNGANPTKSVSVLTTLGTNSVNIDVDYAEGDQPEDSKGIPYGSPEPSGTLNGVATWQGFYYRTAIAGNTAPTATDVRNNYTARRSSAGVINLPSGTTNVRFDVFVPQGSSITQVLDTGNLNLNITSEFELQGSDFSGLDANGDEVLYKHYVRIIDNPYTVSSVLAITVT